MGNFMGQKNLRGTTINLKSKYDTRKNSDLIYLSYYIKNFNYYYRIFSDKPNYTIIINSARSAIKVIYNKFFKETMKENQNKQDKKQKLIVKDITFEERYYNEISDLNNIQQNNKLQNNMEFDLDVYERTLIKSE